MGKTICKHVHIRYKRCTWKVISEENHWDWGFGSWKSLLQQVRSELSLEESQGSQEAFVKKESISGDN